MERRKIRGHEHVSEVILHGLIPPDRNVYSNVSKTQYPFVFFYEHSPGLSASSVCAQNCYSHTELEGMFGGQNHATLIRTLTFCNFSSLILASILTAISENQPILGFYVIWFQFRLEYRINATEIMAIFCLTAEPQTMQTKYSSKLVQNRVLSFPFPSYSAFFDCCL